ncbi:UDP-glucose 4-epimerase GalE [Cumulibacter manganitolerans]|uniref:UDP-glucose 4-epimerase GalE n=1 Tax=Cumulibacter manganitolerans TaxID=1884992 RepID=UPI001296D000|nr:UDP-glucose 4-epimerase GalE [Cumulibacter manganitolerans]
MEILVAGGAGYIGSVCVHALIAAGHRVTVLDDLSTGHRDAVPPDAELIEGSIHNAPRLLRRPFDAAMHFAARSLVAQSVAEPDLYWETNVVGSLQLVRALRAIGVPRLVFSSTAAVYGEPIAPVIDEDHPARPVNTYGATKLAVDHLLASFCGDGFSAISLRYFNVGGSARGLGERHDPETHLVPLVLRAAREGTPVTVFGADYPTPDGTCVRDYLHVEDLAQAHLRALGADVTGHAVINLGTGTGYSVREVVETARRVTGRPIVEQPAGRRPGDPARLVASNARAGQLLGWTPGRGLEDVVSSAWDFYR